jgi:hypothetical protein
MPAQEVTKNFRRLRCGNLPGELLKTNFIHDGLPVGCSRRKLESCGEQILLSGRPSFNFQQFLGRFPEFFRWKSDFTSQRRLENDPIPKNFHRPRKSRYRASGGVSIRRNGRIGAPGNRWRTKVRTDLYNPGEAYSSTIVDQECPQRFKVWGPDLG